MNDAIKIKYVDSYTEVRGLTWVTFGISMAQSTMGSFATCMYITFLNAISFYARH